MNQTVEFWRLKQKADELLFETEAFEEKYHADYAYPEKHYFSVIVTQLGGAVDYFKSEERENYSE